MLQTAGQSPGRTIDVREALDQLELVLDLAALVGALLLGSVVGQSVVGWKCLGANVRVELLGAGTLLERDL